jgi:hypothetical protein
LCKERFSFLSFSNKAFAVSPLLPYSTFPFVAVRLHFCDPLQASMFPEDETPEQNLRRSIAIAGKYLRDMASVDDDEDEDDDASAGEEGDDEGEGGVGNEER